MLPFSSFLPYLSAHRLLNQFRMECDFWSSSLFKRPNVHHLPTFISIEPANFCNLHCPECPVGNASVARPHQYLDEALFDRLLDELSPTLCTVIFFFQGEPLLNRQLPQLIRKAKARHLYTLCSTNAQTLTSDMAKELVQSGLDRLIVSVDGATQATYEQYRAGGKLQKAVAGIGFLKKWKTDLKRCTPLVELQCLRLRGNEHEWDLLKDIYRTWGADRLVFKTAQFYDFEHGNEQMPTQKKFCRYRQLPNGTWVLRGHLHNRCHRLWSGAVVDAEGFVRPCCFDKSGQYAFGSLASNTFRDLWFGSQAKHFRQQILTHRSSIDMCRNCTNF